MYCSMQRNIRFRFIATIALAGATLMLTACASVPEAPTAALAEAKIAISTAEKDNAATYAGPVLAEARRQLVLADAAVVSRQMVEADRLARQSRLAAELASARTEAAKATEVNDQLRKDAKALAEEIQYTGDSK